MRSDKSYYGWRVVAAAFLVAVFAWGLGFYGPSVYVNEIVRSRGWPISIVSGAVTFHFLFSAGLILFLSEAHARFGHVAVTRAGVVAFGIGVIAWSHAVEPWQLYPAAMATGVGWAALSAAAINGLVSPWFVAKRGMALSHAFNGASMGGVVFSPLWAALITRFGFPTATLIVAASGMIVLWPLAGVYFAKRPHDVGQNIDGLSLAPVLSENVERNVPSSRRALLGDRVFLSLSLAFALGIFAQMGLITHLVVRLTPALGAQGAAWALSLATLCAMIGRIALGVFVNVEQRRLAGAANFVMQAIGTLLLVFATTPPGLIIGCVLFGLGIGNLLSLPPLILQSEQRAADVPQALSLLTAISQFFYAFAPGALGIMRDLNGSYVLPFLLAGFAQALSAVILMGGARRRSVQ